MLRGRTYLLLIVCAALVAVLPLAVNGCSCGHDFGFHLVSWLEAAQQFGEGHLNPTWAFAPAYGAGEPRFVFYPPLSWMLGGSLTLLLTHARLFSAEAGFSAVPILYTWVALTAAGLGMFAFAREHVPGRASTIAAVAYVVNPYTLFTAYERTAYAELLAAAFLPLLLHAVFRRSISVSRLAAAIALLWLTNAPAAVMGCYGLLLLASMRLILWRHWSDVGYGRAAWAARVAGGTVLGLALAGFYLVPAAYERRWVQISMAIIPSLRVSDNTIFHHTGDPARDAVIRSASLLAILLAVVTGAVIAWAWRCHSAAQHGTADKVRLVSVREPHWSGALESEPQESLTGCGTPRRPALASLAVLTGIVLLLLTPASIPLWNHVPELAFLQFPWRFLALLATALGLAVAFAAASHRLSRTAVAAICMLIALGSSLPAYLTFRQGCDEETSPKRLFGQFRLQHSFEPTDEYTPLSADNDALQPNSPAYHLLPESADPDTRLPPASRRESAPLQLTLDTTQAQQLILNLRDYPAWEVRRNGVVVQQHITREDGLLTILLPAGHSQIDLRYLRTPDRQAGEALSVLGLAALILCTGIEHRRSRVRTHAGL